MAAAEGRTFVDAHCADRLRDDPMGDLRWRMYLEVLVSQPASWLLEQKVVRWLVLEQSSCIEGKYV